MSLRAYIDANAARAHRRPTEAQKSAGNYPKGHVRVHGLDITIENARGSQRTGIGGDGKKWSVTMPHHYGYIKKTEGVDGDHVDVYLGPHVKSPKVFIVDQVDADTGKFDEHKSFIGFGSKQQAINSYHRAFSDGRSKDRLGSVHEMTIDGFKEWLRSDATRKPIKRAYGGRIPKADGGALLSDADLGFGSNVMSDADMGLGAPSSNKAQDSSWTSYIPAAIRDIPHEAYEATAEQIRNIGKAWTDMRSRREAQVKQDQAGGGFWNPSGFSSVGSDVLDTGKALLSAATVPVAPIQGAARSAIGHPMADIEHAIGTQIAPDIAAKDDPAKMYQQAKGDVDLSLAAIRPRGFTPKGPIASAAADTPETIANKGLADQFGINLSRGQATKDLDAIRYEDMAARGAYGKEAQDRASTFFDKQYQDVQNAGRDVGSGFSRGLPAVDSPSEAASVLSTEVGDRAAYARRLQDMADARAAQEAQAQRGIHADQGRALNDAVAEGALPIENPREAAEIVGQNVRQAAARDRADYQNRYDEAFSLPGEFRADALQGVGNRIQNHLTLGDNPVIIDDLLTPTASRAIQDLDNISNLRIQNRADPRTAPNSEDIAGVDLRGVDQARKRLVAYYKAARASNNPSDVRATGRIIDEFDNQIERAMTEGLFSGDDRALQALQDARGAFSRYQRQYRPQQAGDDVGTAMRRIVDRQATPEEISNMIFGSGKVGNSGLPVRIADRLEGILGRDSDAWSAIRQGVWQKASQARNAAGEIDPVKSSANIDQFVNSSLARRMFSDQERAAMRAHAQGARDLERTIESLPSTQSAERVRAAYQDFFGGDGVAGSAGTALKRLVAGNATPEETSNAVFNIISNGNPGNASRAIKAIERIVGKDSDAMAAIRQGVWQKLTQNAAGKDQPGQQKLMQGINEFLNGSGKTIAEQLYTKQERDLMDKYAQAVKLTIIPKYARTNSDTAVAWMASARKYAGMIGSALGVGFHGGADGGLMGYGVGKILDKVGEKASSARTMKRLDDSLDNFVPRGPQIVPAPKVKSARVLPLALQGGPAIPYQRLLPSAGTIPTQANDQKQ